MVENVQEVCYNSNQIEQIRARLKRIVLNLSEKEQEDLLRMIKEGKREKVVHSASGND